MIMSSALRGCPLAVPSAISRAQMSPAFLIEREYAAAEQCLWPLGPDKFASERW